MPEEVALSSLPPSALQPETKEGLPSLPPKFQVGRILQTYPSAEENRSGGNGSIQMKAHRREESRRPRETPLQSPAGMSDRSEGEIISFSVPSMIGGGCPLLYEDGLSRRAPAASEEMVHGFSASPGAPPAGTFWNEDSSTSCLATDAANRAKSGVGGGSSRQTTVSYVINEASPGLLQAAESGALQSLKEASEAVGADLQTLHFGKLDFGETSVLDRFYNAEVYQPQVQQYSGLKVIRPVDDGFHIFQDVRTCWLKNSGSWKSTHLKIDEVVKYLFKLQSCQR